MHDEVLSRAKPSSPKVTVEFSHSYFVVGKSQVQTSALRLDILMEDFHVFP